MSQTIEPLKDIMGSCTGAPVRSLLQQSRCVLIGIERKMVVEGIEKQEHSFPFYDNYQGDFGLLGYSRKISPLGE